MVWLKWTKTLQAVKGSSPVPLPTLGTSPLCPLRVWEEYTGVLPSGKAPGSIPLLLSTTQPVCRVITVSRLRAMFSRVCLMVDLHVGHRGLTPHSMRRGGATYCFSKGIPLAHIMAHGTWRSAAFERYLLQAPSCRKFCKKCPGLTHYCWRLSLLWVFRGHNQHVLIFIHVYPLSISIDCNAGLVTVETLSILN